MTEQIAENPNDGSTAVEPSKRSRGRETVGDMVRSLAVVMALVGVVVAFNVVDQPEPVVRDIDHADALTEARATLPYDVLAPDPLPDRWRATSARSGRSGGGATWHLGLVTPDENYAAVEQSDGARRGLVLRFADGSRPAGKSTVGGVGWRRLAGGSPDPRALVVTVGGVTTLLTGSGPWSELEELAGSLRGS